MAVHTRWVRARTHRSSHAHARVTDPLALDSSDGSNKARAARSSTAWLATARCVFAPHAPPARRLIGRMLSRATVTPLGTESPRPLGTRKRPARRGFARRFPRIPPSPPYLTRARAEIEERQPTLTKPATCARLTVSSVRVCWPLFALLARTMTHEMSLAAEHSKGTDVAQAGTTTHSENDVDAGSGCLS